MRRLLVIGCWLLVISFFSCAEKVEKPTLADEKITRIMADLFVADAATHGLSGYAKDSLAQVYFQQVLQKHGTTKEEYEKDLRLIAKDLPRMEAIVKGAEESLGGGKKEEGK
jgi:hypothetical protein